MSENNQRPYVAVAHVILHTDRMSESQKFVTALGMRPIFEGPEVSIYELRGGTHLILQQQKSDITREVGFDLMVDDIHEAYNRFKNLGLNPSAIEKRIQIDHEIFYLKDPVGHKISIFSSHVSGKPI